MQIIDKEIEIKSDKDVFFLFPIGDVHLGAFNCAENHFRAYVDYIKEKDNAFWIGGGDYTNAITPMDSRRFSHSELANWIFTGDAMNIKERLMDIAKQEQERFIEIVEPIKDKCLGLIEGNHEYDIMHHTSGGYHYVMCDKLGVPNLTDCSFIRLRFHNKERNSGTSVILLILHGWGGGRTPGAEPNHLARLMQWGDADIVMRGHSHTFRIEPPTPRLYIPRKGALPDECLERDIRAGNWGCWLKSYAAGPSTYDSRANYPARPLQAMEIKIKPVHGIKIKVCGRRKTQVISLISMSECIYQ